MKSDIESEERGPNRNAAEFRIKKAQVSDDMITDNIY